MENGSKLLLALLKASEKAANIARVCRQNGSLFKMLVQEKSAEEKNPRFFRDFKTLADVLIQETIKHDIGLEFPELAKMVQGEENNTFSNTLGEAVTVEVCSTCRETGELLAKVMDSDIETAKLLATEVHRDIQLSEVPTTLEIPRDFSDFDINDLGIWIDPIDSTADYINAVEVIDKSSDIHLSGLWCVTVLIGMYVKSTGLPVLGVINQPFYANANSEWKGICYWGIFENGVGTSSINTTYPSQKIIVLSRAEDATVKAKLSKSGFTLVEVAGAGYKILTVALGQAVAYVLSKGSTYKWDTCGPQALLRSLGGGIVEFKKFITQPDSEELDLKYLSTAENLNRNGLIAYRDPQILQAFKDILVDDVQLISNKL